MWRIILLLPLVYYALGDNIGNTRQPIVHYQDGGYGKILIAIDESVVEDRSLIDEIQYHIWMMSNFMNTATNTKKYVADYTLLIPATWSHDPSWNTTSGESFERARIVIAEGFGTNPDEPYVKQPGLCGSEGDYMHITPSFLQGTDEEFPLRGLY